MIYIDRLTHGSKENKQGGAAYLLESGNIRRDDQGHGPLRSAPSRSLEECAPYKAGEALLQRKLDLPRPTQRDQGLLCQGLQLQVEG